MGLSRSMRERIMQVGKDALEQIIEEAYEEGFSEGHDAGYAEAKEKFEEVK